MKLISNKISSKISSVGERILYFSFCLVFSAALFSCTDDLGIKPDVLQGEENSLIIYIPDVEGAAQFRSTRDDVEHINVIDEVSEGGIDNLWFFAYPIEEDGKLKGEKKITSLSGHVSLNITTAPEGYKGYTVGQFKTGKYHIYLLANFERYLDPNTLSADLSEVDLRKLVLNFSTNKKLEKGHLPMYCLNTEIKNDAIGEAVDSKNGVFEINVDENNETKGAPSIYADLTFLCSKVRYTVLFDKTEKGFSNQFENLVDLTGSDVKAQNLSSEIALTSEGTVTNTSSWYETSKLSKVVYPEENSLYFNIKTANAESAPANLSELSGTTSTWRNTNQRAWQGVVYLPENLSDNPSNITISNVSNVELPENLEFPAIQMERGKMYDFVAKLKKTDIEFDLNVKNWTMQEVAYTLHGPYELVVEYTHLDLQSGYYSVVGYDTDTHISFDFPMVKFVDNDGEVQELPFYKAEPFTPEGTLDENAVEYVLNPDFKNHFRVKLNPDIPFKVLYNLELSETNPEVEGYEFSHNGETILYTNEKLNYFHVVAGNLHKKITTTVSHNPYLIVTPHELTVDVHEYYLSGQNLDDKNLTICFETNYEAPVIEGGVELIDFNFVDNSGLVQGLGYKTGNYHDLQIIGDDIDLEYVYEDEKDNNVKYPLRSKRGFVTLRIENMIGDHDIWSQYREFIVKFEITVRNPNKPTEILETISEEVKIVIIPFNANYIIHFKDFTGNWNEAPHVYILQDLLLPADLWADPKDHSKGISVYAGKIVGYLENTTDGINANAAAQYVFTNNISFRGWKGYGGPDINDPYDKIEPESPTAVWPNSNSETEGFVMFGSRNADGSWNNDYGYTVRTAISTRHERYNYDLNFNDAHVKRIENGEGWQCYDCLDRNEYINIGLQHDYPGIVMEKETGENEGWWRYTLVGVAQPGKTMIIFANGEAPWDQDGGEAQNRYPGSYNTGLALFDFEDNEGWFGYHGQNSEQSSPTPHYFFDEKKDAEAYNSSTR